MEKAQTSLWGSVNPDQQIRPKIVFEFNIPVTVRFPENFTEPEEYPSQYSDEENNKPNTYCVFSVIHEDEESAIVTSAYSLLRGLKALMPLANKTVTIVKKMEKGKQQYLVTQVI